jgi:hypothetical protein
MFVIKNTTTKDIIVATSTTRNIITPQVLTSAKTFCIRDVCGDSKSLVAMVRSMKMEKYNPCR